MKIFKRIFAISLALLICISFLSVGAAKPPKEITILFTNDLHSHLLPATDSQTGESYGGYARLKTVIDEQKAKNPDAILVDGGDFSMGSLFQTAFATSAIELRMMGKMGYDATTFGNHEFDYLQDGLISMLSTAKQSGDKLPYIVNANYKPEENNKKMQNALDDYGVKDYVIIERGGEYFVLFGIFGIDSDECAPNSEMILQDAVTTAQKTVETAVSDCLETYKQEPIVVCLSHSGTEDGEGEDFELAKAVDGIDVIISGHTHTTLEEPIKVNDTFIVSAGEYGKNLGVLTFEKNYSNLVDYKLIKIDDSIKEDKKIKREVENFKKNVEKDYLNKYNLTFDQVVIENDVKFDTVDEVYATQHESTLGNLFSDAYKWAASEAIGEEVDLALTASGVIRESIPKGPVSVSDVFNAASLGVGTEGELISVYITGKDLKNALEVDASVQPIMSSAQLFFSGVEYSFNTNRMIFNKVDYAMMRKNDGSLHNIQDEKLYRVVTGMYVGQMLGAVESTSFGLLTITPRDKNGNPISAENLKNYIVMDKSGNPIKEWYAIASYLQQMGGKMNENYSKEDERKVVYSSFNPVKLLRNANKFTYIAIAVVLVVLATIILITRAIVKKHRKKKQKMQ